MADIIHLLPDSVANQIAAGEVVQRPSSVIKELVENAVDAGATHIDVLVENAGSTSIQVVDDGKGMSETDARLAFERHATSKIRKATDLYSLTTMGFRGEALPSIAAVAQVTLRTRLADEALGTCLDIEGGKVLSQEADGCPVGSNFLVRNLFFNVPARRRFLKSSNTEMSNIIQEFNRIALVNPGIQINLFRDGNAYVQLPIESQKKRIGSLFGHKLCDQLLNVEVDTSLCRISGFVGRPDSSKKKGAHQYLFVNGRYMRHPYFHKAIQTAFEGLIPSTDQVPYFLYFQVDPSSIDVNVHPTKTEIKFENEQAIWQIVLASVREALGRFNAVPTIDFDTEGRPEDMPVYTDNRVVETPRMPVSTGYNPFAVGTTGSSRHTAGWDDFHVDSFTDIPTQEAPLEELFIPEDTKTSEVQHSSQCYQYHGRYLITETETGLMIVDQHRAHARILYNRYRAQMEERSGASQRLLFPDMVQFPPSECALLEEVRPDLSFLGFEIEDLGGGSFSVLGVPAGVDGIQPQSLLTEMLTNISEGGKSLKEEIHHRMALTMARNAAIPAGQVLSAQEMNALIDDLLATDNPNQTPDGKTIIAFLEHQNVEKMFK